MSSIDCPLPLKNFLPKEGITYQGAVEGHCRWLRLTPEHHLLGAIDEEIGGCKAHVPKLKFCPLHCCARAQHRLLARARASATHPDSQKDTHTRSYRDGMRPLFSSLMCAESAASVCRLCGMYLNLQWDREKEPD